jgi:hypothetical protein
VVPAATPADALTDDEATEPFDWFGLAEPASVAAAPTPITAAPAAVQAREPARAERASRDAGRAPATTDSAPLPRRRPTFVDPEPTVDVVPTPSRSGLTRRVPGMHMAEGFADSADRPTIRTSRDPEAERDAINDFIAGLARGNDTDAPGPVHSSSQSVGERPT